MTILAVSVANKGFDMSAIDPWKHRSSGMSCRSCMWYVAKVPDSDKLPKDYKGIGRCRRHAPSMNGYPVVWVSDWCGDHKLDENKLGA